MSLVRYKPRGGPEFIGYILEIDYQRMHMFVQRMNKTTKEYISSIHTVSIADFVAFERDPQYPQGYPNAQNMQAGYLNKTMVKLEQDEAVLELCHRELKLLSEKYGVEATPKKLLKPNAEPALGAVEFDHT